MTIYKVSVRATYYEDLEVEGCDVDEAYKNALKDFKPEPDNMLAIDVFGLDPWRLNALQEDPHAGDPYDQV